MHKYRTLFCKRHNIRIYLIAFQILNPFCPDLVRLSHRYPYIGINDVCPCRCLCNIFCQRNGCPCLRCCLPAGAHKRFIREILLIGTGTKIHPELCTGCHQRITHIVAGIPHIYKPDSLKPAKPFADSQHICNHLRRMKFVCQPVPYRHACIRRQFFHNFLPESAVFDTVKHPAKHPGRISNAFLASNLGTGRVEVSHMHAQVMRCHFKCTPRPGACLFKNQRNIFPSQLSMRDSFFLFFLEFSRKLYQIQNFFRRKIKQLQKTPAL